MRADRARPRPARAARPARGAALRLVAPIALAVLLAGGRVRGQDFGPVGAPWVLNEDTPFTQEWCRVACDRDGGRLGFVWETVVGHDVQMRLFDGDGAPLTPEVRVNTTLTDHIQDEPCAAMDAAGNLLVAWSDRHGYDGDMMGVFARLYDAAGAPLTAEFGVNVEWAESQWEPLAAALPDGRWLVAWSGRSNGDAFFRLFSAAGAPLGGDVQVNTFDNNAQIDVAPAVARDGTLLLAFVDFGGNGAGGGQTVFGRRFDAAGAPLGAEWQLHDTLSAGDQREPRVAANGLRGAAGRFVAVWEDHAVDGSGAAIVARVFDTAGSAVGPEFVVNQSTAGDQHEPALACDWVGNFVVAWTDESTLPSRVVARRFAATGAPLGDEFVVAQPVLGDARLPSVAVDAAGEDVVFAYTAPHEGGGAPSGDAYARRFAFEPVRLVDPPALGTTFDVALHFPGGAGLFHILLAAFGTAPGVPLPDGRTVPLTVDILFDLTLAQPDGAVFAGFQGFLGPSAQATASIALPPNPAFIGLTFHLAAVTVDATQLDLIDQLRHVTEAIDVVLE